MKKIISILAIVLLLSCFVKIALAHPGKTDSQGGHTDHSTGEYHYHHGYPAHQHTNGKCPYDYHNNTEDDSDSSNYEASESYDESSGTSNSHDVWDVLRIVFAVSIALFCTAELWTPWVESLWKWIKKLIKSNGSSGDE